MGSEWDMNFLLGKMSFGLLLSYPIGGVMPSLFPKMYKVELSSREMVTLEEIEREKAQV